MKLRSSLLTHCLQGTKIASDLTTVLEETGAENLDEDVVSAIAQVAGNVLKVNAQLVAAEQNSTNTTNSTAEVFENVDTIFNKLAGSVLKTAVVGEAPTILELGDSTFTFEKTDVDNLDNAALNVEGGSFSLPDSKTLFDDNVRDIRVQVLVHRENVFTFAEDADRVGTNIVSLAFFDENTGDEVSIKNLDSPIELTIPIRDEPSADRVIMAKNSSATHIITRSEEEISKTTVVARNATAYRLFRIGHTRADEQRAPCVFTQRRKCF